MKNFYSGKKVLVTGHTGFKGSWLCRILHLFGAEVYGYALAPPVEPNLYNILNSDEYVKSKIGDISDYSSLSNFYSEIRPDCVFHLAAQPLVRVGYSNPRETYISNVVGTVNILECARNFGAKSFLNVTTDKVYDNIEDYNHRYNENDRLDGFDPYSNSKSCSELVTHSYIRSFEKLCPVSTARAGNVIGGGDFARDRIIPDCIRAAINNEAVLLRNPQSIRPYQHVLEPLFAYLLIVKKQSENRAYSSTYNIGPDEEDCVTTGELTELFCKKWGNGLKWNNQKNDGPHEANYLKLDNTKMRSAFGISPIWHISDAVEKTVDWTKSWANHEDIRQTTDSQIIEYLKERGVNV